MLVFVIFNICTKYDTIFDKCCSILYKDFKTSKYLLTFPNTPIFIIDNLTAILALHLHDKVFNTSEYTECIQSKTRACQESQRSSVNSRHGDYGYDTVVHLRPFL